MYRSLIGEHMYLSICTRTDIIFATCSLAESLNAPCGRHTSIIERVIRYLSATQALGILCRESQQNFVVGVKLHLDPDWAWAGCKLTRQSTTGKVINILGSPVASKITGQNIIALYSTWREIAWLRRIIWESSHRLPFYETSEMYHIETFTDHTASISLPRQQVGTARIKHIKVKYHHGRHMIRQVILSHKYIPSKHQLPDYLTRLVHKSGQKVFLQSVMHTISDSNNLECLWECPSHRGIEYFVT